MRFKLHLLIFLCSIFFGWNAFGQFTADFSASSVTACAGDPINFTDLSSSPTGIISWVWDFGDGNSSTTQNPTHVYSAAGTYTVILTVNNGSSSIDEVKTGYILIHPLPQPSFSVSNPPCTLPATVTLSNVSPASGVSYAWDFGNGQTSNVQQPSGVNYTTEGTYTIELTVTQNSTGCSNSYQETVNIYNYNTDFTPSSSTVCVGSSATFTENCTPGTDQFSWTFGNGHVSTSPNPTVVYNSTGSFTVTLTSENSATGCTDVATNVIQVIAAQVPSLTPSLTIGCNPSTVTFSNTSGFNGTFSWNFGNGQTFNGTNPPPQTYDMEEFNEYPYPESESFNVILNSVDENGCSSYQVFPNLITIYNIFPEFEASVVEGCEILDVSFTDQSYSPIPGFQINSWNWNFGNGQTFSGQNPPTQSYSEGVYDVSLTVTTANGCTATLDSIEMIEVGIPPDVLFTVDPDTICARQNGIFTNLSTISVPSDPSEIDYIWYIGSQGPYANFEPNQVPILDTGSLDVTLIVSFRGCRDTMILENEIYVHAPLVQFAAPQIICNPGIPVEVTITDYTILGQSGDSVSVFWNLGNGTTYSYDNADAWLHNNQSFDETYLDYGTYQIKQIATNYNTGCTDSLATTLNINYFNVDLDFNRDSICLGDTSIFYWTYESIDDFPPSNFGYIADQDSSLGDYSSGLVTNPDQIYFNSPGYHLITLNAINGLGCQATITDSFFIAPLPIAQIGTAQIAGCTPTTALFEDSSTSVSGVPIVDYNWIFNEIQATSGNGQPSITTNIDSTGTHTAILQITDELGCTAFDTLETVVIEPIADFEAPVIICNNSYFQTTNLSSNYVSSEWYLNGQLVSTDDDGNFLISHPPDGNVSFTDNIQLIVSDANGCSSTITIPILVSAPQADYSYNLTGSNVDEFGNFTCPSVFAAFTDNSQAYGNIVNWSWDFGDGKTSSLQNPSNTYVFAGTYTSSLIITDEYGCMDTISNIDFLTISGPSGDFEVGPAGTQCDPNYLFETVQLNNVTEVIWYSGNGDSFSDIDGGEYIYPQAGTYFPYVTISDANNCTVTYYLDTVTVQFGDLNAAFSGNPMTLNWGEPIIIENESTGGIGGIVNNNWSFGNDNFNEQNDQFQYLFNEAGEIEILLITTDAIGCIDSAWITVIVTDNLQFPNVFSPNGDGSNDIFRIRANAYGEYTVVILNRWGNIMSESQVINDSYLWDGYTRSGEIANEGVYYYYVKGTLRDGSPKEDQGFFHLIME